MELMTESEKRILCNMFHITSSYTGVSRVDGKCKPGVQGRAIVP